MTDRQIQGGLSNGIIVLAIGMIVSLHFIPRGRILHVRAYLFVGIAGCAISLVACSAAVPVERQMFLGGAIGALLWLSAACILWRSDRIVAKAVREEWHV
jgi:hypothetical protein